MIGIYKITNPKGKVYIGQSINIKNRLRDYKNLKCEKQTKLYRSFLKYGFYNHKIEIIKECEISELNHFERYYQDLFNCLDKGLNCVLTKSNDKSGCLSNETKIKISISNLNPPIERRIKMSNAQKGKIVPLEMRLKISKSHLGKKHTKETREKISFNSTNISEETRLKYRISHTGKKQTEESKLKISKALKGKKRSDEIRKKISQSKGIKVVCVLTKKEFNSVKEASLFLNCNAGNLHLKLKGIRKNNTTLKYKQNE